MKNSNCITVANQKGGVAKTTTSLAFASMLAAEGKKVLAVDFDHQGDFTLTLTGKRAYEFSGRGVFDYAENFNNEDDADKRKYIQHTKIENVDLLPASSDSPRIIDLLNVHASVLKKIPYTILNKYIDALAMPYDVVVVDTPPDKNIILSSCVYMADHLIIPTEADEYSEKAVYDMLSLVESFRTEHPTTFNAKIATIFITKWRKNTISELERDAISRACGDLFATTMIRDSCVVKESAKMKQSVVDYSPNSTVGKDYIALYKEIKDKIDAK